MPWPLAGILLAAAVAIAKADDNENEIFRQLLDRGVPIGGDEVKLPAPTLSDGLNAPPSASGSRPSPRTATPGMT